MPRWATSARRQSGPGQPAASGGFAPAGHAFRAHHDDRGHRPTAVGGVNGQARPDELRAFGVPGADGKIVYSLHATVLQLVADRLIVLSWRNKAWDCAIDSGDVGDIPSTVVLTFRDNFADAEIGLNQVNVPDYKVKIPDTGEVGPLSQIVNTHWSLLYWEPMQHYFAPRP